MIAKDKLFSKFLGTAYLLEALVGGLISRAEDIEIFNKLAEIYLIDDVELLDRFRELSFSEDYYNMNTLEEYERACRMLEYAQVRGIDAGLTPDDKRILSAKRVALRCAKDILPEVENLNPDAVTDALLKGISVGNIIAMIGLAFLNYTGYAIGKNPRRALVNLNHAARWNSLDANLFLAYFDPSRAQECIARILASDKGSDTKELADLVSQAYGVSEAASDECSALLERAFCLGAVERNICDVTFEHIIYSGVISPSDKKMIIESYNKNTMAHYDGIPAYADATTPMTWDRGAFSDMSIKREDEIRRIKSNLVGIKGRARPHYKPLLLVCRDAFVLGEYKRALGRALGANPIRVLDARHFGDYTFSQSTSNVFISEIAISRTMSTVFMIDFVHAINPGLMPSLCKFLDAGTRAHFRILQPSVGIDLSGILPILFSQSEPDGELEQYCDVIRLAPISDAEKGCVISEILERYLDAYDIENVTLSSSVIEKLKGKSCEQIEDAIDEIVKYMALEDKSGVVDDECLTLVLKGVLKNTVKFGF